MEEQRESALESVTASLSAAATREEILKSMLSVGCRVLVSSAAVAYVRGAEGTALELVAHEGIPGVLAAQNARIPLDSNSPVARAVREERALWVSNREELEREFPDFYRNAAGAFDGQAVVALPLRVSGAFVGAVAFAFPEPHAFDGGERTFMTTLAARCEVAMERALLYEESQRSRAQAESLLRFHEVVSGILAHDLKNPLAAVLMNARMLRTAESERSRNIGARIVTSGERMGRMIEQILDWTRLRGAGTAIKLAPVECDLGKITDEVVAELRARKGEVPILVETSGNLGGTWDRDRLAQVVSNLVGNALDHATRPGVSIAVADAGPEVSLTVGNEGTIDDAILSTLFEPFRGGATAPRRSGRGLGLGLFITREIVRAHGGRVEVHAPQGPRVSFVATLPRTT